MQFCQQLPVKADLYPAAPYPVPAQSLHPTCLWVMLSGAVGP